MFELTQAEADILLNMPKRRVSEQEYEFSLIERIEIRLESTDGREQFLLDLSSGRIDLLKRTFQSRVRVAIVLARLDLGGAPHRNPDGEEIACPHLHVYREGYGDKWAYPLTQVSFKGANDWELFSRLPGFLRCRRTSLLPPELVFMMNEIETLMASYWTWLKDETKLREIGDWIQITTPSLDRHNDRLQIYAKKEHDTYLLTDDSYTLRDLAMSGCNLDTPKTPGTAQDDPQRFRCPKKQGCA